MAPKRKCYTEDQLLAALNDIKYNNLSVSSAGRKHKVPRSTLWDKIAMKYNPLKDKPGPDTIMSLREEAKLVQYLEGLCAIGHGITQEEFRKEVKKFLDDSDIEPRSDKYFKDNMPSRGWVYKFRNRYKDAISRRKPQHFGMQRANVRESDIQQWFKDLKLYLLEEHNIVAEDFLTTENSSRIFTCNESRFPLCGTGKTRVLTAVGAKKVFSVGNVKKEQISMLGMCSADGNFNKPMVIDTGLWGIFTFNGINAEDYALGRSESGCITSEVFFEYVTNIFYQEIKDKVQFPIIFFFDGHNYQMNLHLSEFCHSNNIIAYCFPPNASLIKPFDVSVYGLLKKYYSESLCNTSLNQKGPVTKAQFIEVLDTAWTKAKRSDMVKKCFKECGLVPFNPNVVDYKNLLVEKPCLEKQRKPNVYEKMGVERCIRAFEALLPAEHLPYFQKAIETNCSTLGSFECMANIDANFAFRVYKSFHNINKGIAIVENQVSPAQFENYNFSNPDETDDHVQNSYETEDHIQDSYETEDHIQDSYETEDIESIEHIIVEPGSVVPTIKAIKKERFNDSCFQNISNCSVDEELSSSSDESDESSTLSMLVQQLKAARHKKKKSFPKKAMLSLLNQQQKILTQQEDILSRTKAHDEEIRNLMLTNKRAAPSNEPATSSNCDKLAKKIKIPDDFVLNISSIIKTAITKEVENLFAPEIENKKKCHQGFSSAFSDFMKLHNSLPSGKPTELPQNLNYLEDISKRPNRNATKCQRELKTSLTKSLKGHGRKNAKGNSVLNKKSRMVLYDEVVLSSDEPYTPSWDGNSSS